jgi:hypothetical protein
MIRQTRQGNMRFFHLCRLMLYRFIDFRNRRGLTQVCVGVQILRACFSGTEAEAWFEEPNRFQAR